MLFINSLLIPLNFGEQTGLSNYPYDKGFSFGNFSKQSMGFKGNSELPLKLIYLNYLKRKIKTIYLLLHLNTPT